MWLTVPTMLQNLRIMLVFFFFVMGGGAILFSKDAFLLKLRKGLLFFIWGANLFLGQNISRKTCWTTCVKYHAFGWSLGWRGQGHLDVIWKCLPECICIQNEHNLAYINYLVLDNLTIAIVLSNPLFDHVQVTFFPFSLNFLMNSANDFPVPISLSSLIPFTAKLTNCLGHVRKTIHFLSFSFLASPFFQFDCFINSH